MYLSLSNVKTHDDMSEKSLSFSAVLCVSEVMVGMVKNLGVGEKHRYSFISIGTQNLVMNWASEKMQDGVFTLDNLVSQMVKEHVEKVKQEIKPVKKGRPCKVA